MSVDYVVEVSRIVWGDYCPKRMGVVTSEDEHIKMLHEDAIERFRGSERLRVYSFILWEIDDEDHSSRVSEMVAYGDEKKIEESIKELWENWIVRYEKGKEKILESQS